MSGTLQGIFGERLLIDEPLSKHSTYRVGGPAKWFVEARSEEDVVAAVRLAREHAVRLAVFGGGTNILFADEGFPGLIVKMAMRKVVINGSEIIAEAGALSALTARQSAEAGLTGFEWAASLPGTIGGAVRGNAGAFGGEMKDSVSRVDILREGSVVSLSNEEMKFGYRDSTIKHSNDIVLRVVLTLVTGDSEDAKALVLSLVEKRNASQPHVGGSAGCAFKNYEATDEELVSIGAIAEIPASMMAEHRLAAGWLIDQAGLKGLFVRDAYVSEQHGNFIVNRGKATAQDIKDLIQKVKEGVSQRFGIVLQEEIQYIGFENSNS